MNINKVTVTPKKAAEWIKRNVANRPLSQSTVNSYAKAMTAGAWKLNGDAIRFNCNGDLIDGQHRLHACIKSGKSFDSFVIKGLQQEAFDTIDQGKKRSISDVFARDGYKHYTALAGAASWLFRYSAGDLCYRGGPAIRPDEAHELLERHPGLHAAVDLACRLRSQQALLGPALLAFLIYMCSQKDEQRAESFWTSVITGVNLVRGSAAHLLNKRLVSNYGSVAKLHSTTVCALCIKAWNAHIKNKPCGTLKWVDGEEFPKFA